MTESEIRRSVLTPQCRAGGRTQVVSKGVETPAPVYLRSECKISLQVSW
jgi:hypothetical protein